MSRPSSHRGNASQYSSFEELPVEELSVQPYPSVIFANTNGLRTSWPDVLNLIITHNPLAVCLCETLVVDPKVYQKSYKVGGYRWVKYKGSAAGARGLSVLLRNDVGYERIGAQASSEIMVLRIFLSCGATFILSTAYNRCGSVRALHELDTVYSSCNDESILTVGDLNARARSWCHSSNPAGTCLSRFLPSWNASVLNPYMETCFRKNGKSTVDLAICNDDSLVHDVQVAEDINSDHLPVIIHLNIQMPPLQRRTIEKWNLKDASWENFGQWLRE